jgi:hypothetical protein
MKSLSARQSSGTVAFVVLLMVYAATLAPTVTFWDSGEFLAAIHSLGIPHPPGTPLYVIVANVWSRIAGPILGFTRAVNLFSAICAAAGCALFAALFARWMRNAYIGAAAGICAGLTSTLWLSATETEVYGPAFLVAALLLWIANEFRESQDSRYLVLLVYTASLGWALHLTALIALPAAAVLVLANGVTVLRARMTARVILKCGAAAVIGISVALFMYVRAAHDPAINQGNPASLPALWDVITRRQYDPAGIWPRRAPLYLQFGNLFEWADWQFALGLDANQPPGYLRTPVTLFFAVLGVIGSWAHRRRHRVSWRAMITLLITATVGVVIYLNLKAGPSYGIGLLGPTASHEARERDYFFILAWVTWGLWAGTGAFVLCSLITRNTWIATSIAFMLAAAPLALNWRAVDRRSSPESREAAQFATDLLRLVPARGVLLAQGDNDTYPVWYLREVESSRPDVITITVPMLPTRWYRAEIARRFGLLDMPTVTEWKGTDATVRVICKKAEGQSRKTVGPIDVATRTLNPAC